MKHISVYILFLSLISCASHRIIQGSTDNHVPEDVQVVFFSSLISQHCGLKPKECAVAINSLPIENEVLSSLRSRFPGLRNANKHPWATDKAGFSLLGSVIYLNGPAKVLSENQVEVSGGLFLGWTGGYECQFVLTRESGQWQMPSPNSPKLCTLS